MKQNNKISSGKSNCPNNCFSEIVESSLDRFVAQCWDWNDPPRFGSLVETCNKKINIIGCVTNIETKSMDPTRYPFPYKKTEEELLAEQPQIFEFLKTNFEVQVLGYQESKIFYMRPPYPAKIHSFVCKLSQEKTCQFFSNIDFIYTLFSAKSETNLDELVLAIFSQLKSEPKILENILGQFYKSFHFLTGNDYKRAKMFFRRMQDMV